MSKNSKISVENRRDEARIDRAVRRAVGIKFARPSLRSLLRACGVYANVIAAVVALGIPTAGGLRSAAGSAALAFESAVRSARESTSELPDLLTNPADLTEVTESAGEVAAVVENPRELRSVESVPSPSLDASASPVIETPEPSAAEFEIKE